MALVDYSDSEDSGSDSPKTTAPKPSTSTSTPTPTPTPTSSSTGKPSFQKVVDRSNPGKIKVSLPQASLKDDTKTDEPPTKRVKTGGGGAFSGFNSFLPAPKRTGQSTNTTLGGGNVARKSGLGAGISLKTGATPAFSREPEPLKEYKEDESARDEESSTGSGLNLPPPNSLVDGQKPADEVKLVGKPLMFKPLSVSRKPAKKKIQKPESITSTPAHLNPEIETPATPQNSGKATPKPKVSLFSLEVEPVNMTPNTTSNGEYKPMLYQSSSSQDQEPTYEDYTPTTSHTLPFAPTPPVNHHNTESLSSIADTLHLSAAERRQLFGRQKGGSGPQATKIINFNTDQEYAHNEELRAAGEQVVHNPVRSIAPGKHSLKQLVGAAQSQKEALEESFATGRNNRKEAGSKYGW
ncbi:hypothetical protein MFRU_032g00280 [Monilinia fructicola]|uniref:Mitotic checkpoint regulator, MAD2B-interacting-domain-containing protein n=1 Tax=Monilinia fructicola TaxID=38448 RepID=A0A5M9J9Q2_MONFR|nr:hypothetical protein EYC84_012021 [Monilinia fructicola]KAG4027162.1 hypothetical protein MFRU_032g00280 [Monilinia fructicola]